MMLNAIKKFLSSSSPSKKPSPQHNSDLKMLDSKGNPITLDNFHLRKAAAAAAAAAASNTTSSRMHSNDLILSDEEELSRHQPILHADSRKKRTLEDKNDDEDDPFTDKENNPQKILGDNFIRIPELLTKKQKTDHHSNERTKYRLSVAKQSSVTSEDRAKDETRIVEDKTPLVRVSTQEDGKDDETEEEDEEEEIITDKKQQQQQHQQQEEEAEYSEISDSVREEIANIRSSFKNLDKKYKLIDKIGEGTFSTVYKAKVLTPEIQNINLWNSPPIKRHNGSSKHSDNSLKANNSKKSKRKIKYVALKRIYVTSSPQRIYNELNLLYTLTGCSKVAPLIDAIRYQDQVIAVLPYYRHSDFRYFYRDLSLDGIKIYMFELLSALSFVHSHHIIHRDIKPTNFLYDPFKRRGVLVDFGLAEKELILDSSNTSNCLCYRNHTQNKIHESFELQNLAAESHLKGYPKDDARPGRRANRAGTRGFRAPEVLFKCANQTSKIDIWSAGVVLLTLLSRRFTFFNSPDDVDALVELTTLFGYEAMKRCANLHGLGLDTSIHKLRANSGYPMSQIIQWAVYLDASNDTFAEDSPALETLEAIDSNGRLILDKEIGVRFKDGIDLLDRCFDMNPYKRITADEALAMPFFKELRSDRDEDVNLD